VSLLEQLSLLPVFSCVLVAQFIVICAMQYRFNSIPTTQCANDVNNIFLIEMLQKDEEILEIRLKITLKRN
jgi:hypothetical protein